MLRKHVLIIARQAGTANAFQSTVEEFRRRDWTVTLGALDAAQKVWAAQTVHHLTTPDAIALVQTTEADVLLTGSSFKAADDGAIWDAAHRAELPCVAYVDEWKHYAERFSVDRPFDHMPDHIAVIDDIAADALAADGCPIAPHVVGNLVFDALSKVVPGSTGRNVMIATEPIPDYLGFCELEVVEALLTALPNELEIVLKPHPREKSAKYAALVAGHPGARLAHEAADRRDLMSASRAVIGMTSMLLVEAAHVGLPALAVQPTGGEPVRVYSKERGIETVTNLEQLRPALAALLEHEVDAHEPGRPSAPGFVDLLVDLAARK